jgi:TolA-binding protein
MSLHVEKLVPGQRFLAALPDGELEVRGTRFEIEVHDGSTTRVEVSEGAVALRLRGQSERRIAAGERWSPDEASPVQRGVTVSASAPSATADAIDVSDAPTALPPSNREPRRAERIAAPPPSDSLHTAGAKRGTPSAQPIANDTAGSPAGTALTNAMNAMSAGSYERADELLADFELRFPGDSRAEDAAFLRIVIRQRLDDNDGAARQARQYLARYPHALRRREAERLLPPSR